jgi:hypothetical protein
MEEHVMTTRMTPSRRAAAIEKLEKEAAIIRQSQAAITRAARRRDLYIVKLLDGGMTEREVGEHANLTGPRVHQIYHTRPATSTKPKRKARR